LGESASEKTDGALTLPSSPSACSCRQLLSAALPGRRRASPRGSVR
jgi:hypothetical protein